MSKYIFYAIGEIVLVVIGILIALSINNWNEEQKSQAQFDALLVKVQKELLINIAKCNVVIKHCSEKDSLYYNVLNKKVTYNNYKNDRLEDYGYRTLLSNYEIARLYDDASVNLIDFNGSLSKAQDSILGELTFLNGTLKNIVDEDDIKVQHLNDYFYEKAGNEIPSFSSYDEITLNDEMIEYFLNDPFYLNRVLISMKDALYNSLSSALTYESKAIMIHNQISEYFSSTKTTTFYPKIQDYSEYVGEFMMVEQGTTVVLQIDEENELLQLSVVVENDTIEKLRAYPLSKNRFIVKDAMSFMTFNYNKEGEVDELILGLGSQRSLFAKK